MDNNQHYDSFDEILEECVDVQLELEDICESFELLVYDVEMGMNDITEMIERVQDHLSQVKKAYQRCADESLMQLQEAVSQKSL